MTIKGLMQNMMAMITMADYDRRLSNMMGHVLKYWNQEHIRHLVDNYKHLEKGSSGRSLRYLYSRKDVQLLPS